MKVNLICGQGDETGSKCVVESCTDQTSHVWDELWWSGAEEDEGRLIEALFYHRN